MLALERIKRTDERILIDMQNHYSQPKGFVGRNICYAVMYDNIYYGAIVGGSATLHLAGRNDWLLRQGLSPQLNNIINNIFFHIEGPYPVRNFSQQVLKIFHETIKQDWKQRYGDEVLAFETLVELPRTGEVYLRFGYERVGLTVGYTCKRIGGIGTDDWSGKRVWNTDKNQLRPKHVFMLRA